MARESRAVWARRVEQWSRSGLSGAEFAARLGVKEATLRHWKWYLGCAAEAALSTRRPAFVEVVPRAEEAPGAGLELVVGAARVLIPVGFDEETLGRLLRVVEGR